MPKLKLLYSISNNYNIIIVKLKNILKEFFGICKNKKKPVFENRVANQPNMNYSQSEIACQHRFASSLDA